MYTCYLAEQDFKDAATAFSHFSALGISEADVIDDECKGFPLSEYKATLERSGISLSTIVSVEDILSPGEVLRGAAIIRVKALIDEMKRLGIQRLMLAPPIGREGYGEREAVLTRMLEVYGRILSHAKEQGIEVSIENQSSEHRPDSKISEVEYILESLPDLKFTLDAGNFLCVGEDVLAAYERLKGYIVRAHIKDWTCSKENEPIGNIRRADLSGCAIGDGILPLGELCERMHRDGLDIALTLEINAPRITTDMIERSARCLSSLVTE